MKISPATNAAPITDTQLDFLVSEWESTIKKSTITLEERERVLKSDKYSHTEELLRQSLEDGVFPISDAENDENVQALRGSLNDALDYISDKEGLTDDELQERLAAIGAYTSKLSTGWKDHMTQVHNSVIGTMPITLEQGTGTWPMSSREPSVKLLRLSSSSSNPVLSQKSIRFSDDGGDFPLMGSLESISKAHGKDRYSLAESIDSDAADKLTGERYGNIEDKKSSFGKTATSVSSFEYGNP